MLYESLFQFRHYQRYCQDVFVTTKTPPSLPLNIYLIERERRSGRKICVKLPHRMALETLLQEVDKLKAELNKLRSLDNAKIQEALAVEYTYESNRIEGNTLTLQETQLVIEKGLTIGGKSLKEHLEAINHKEAIDFIGELVKKESVLDESTLKQIHSIILKSI